ncbi:cell division protein [Sporolactobacillus vineae]|uniref:cell division protein n=1 Tax=Sporolactobacillus vineae TaxID=444463 RepID=UPI000289181E|nr:cell division protein [Sporolactobacillus vineae]
MWAIIRSILFGIATFFMNPLFYLLVVGLFLFSAQRVRRERRSFRVKAYGMFNTVFRSIAPSLVVGVGGSILLLAAGVAVPPGMIVLFSLGYLVIMLTTQLRFLSPAVAGGLTLIAAYLLPPVRTPLPLVNQWITEVRQADLFAFAVFLAVAMLAETMLVLLWGAKQTSPRLIQSGRGGMVGAHEASELWIVPFLFLVPLAGPVGHIGLWPFVSGSSQNFGFALFPLGVGIAQLITSSLPAPAVKRTGYWLLFTTGGFLVIAGTGAYLHLPVVIVAGGVLALISRLLLLFYHHELRSNRPFYFVMPEQGLRVIGVIPHSLGDRIGVRPGEEIQQVNDRNVNSERNFYDALQAQSAYIKIKVIDRFGEPRFVKGPVHQDDGHKIGLLFLESSEINSGLKSLS